MKTIKQIADALGVDKQRVYRYIKKNCISEAHHEHDTKYYDEATETAIIKHFSKSEAHHEAHHTTSNDTVIDTVIAMLKKELDGKNAQIESQQQTIREQAQSIQDLTAALERTTASIQTAQALHAGTMQHQLLPEASAVADVAEEPSVKRRGFFGWLDKIK